MTVSQQQISHSLIPTGKPASTSESAGQGSSGHGSDCRINRAGPRTAAGRFALPDLFHQFRPRHDGGFHRLPTLEAKLALPVGLAIDQAKRGRHDLAMLFEILGEISDVETFAIGSGIREIARLRRVYGRGRWRKRKGVARIRLSNGSTRLAELHWYEAAGIGRKEFKIKHLL
jgi:hypothetical protein